MGDNSNPFLVVFAIVAVILVVSEVVAVAAPSLGFGDSPTAPDFPSWASNLSWTVTLTDWSGIGSAFVLFGGIIVYFFTYVVWMIAEVSFFFTMLGAAPVISYGITGLIFVVFTGSLLMFIRGSSGGSK